MLNSSRYDARFWLVTLSTVLFMGLTAKLGFWQLSRAEQKLQTAEKIAVSPTIQLSGHWAADQTVYIDNRQMAINGLTVQGFFVVTPLLVSANDYVLVQRGWIARNFADRKNLPAIDTPLTQSLIAAQAMTDAPRPFTLNADAHSDYPIVQYLDYRLFSKHFTDKTYRGLYRQVGAPSQGMHRNWWPVASGVDKHYGYAVQWFALCALTAALYIWFQWIKNAKK